jgi:ATP-binding cassette, subfamily C, bacterial CydD
MRVLRVAFLSSAVMEFFSAVAIGLVAIYIGFGLLGYLDFGPAPQLTLFSGLFILLLAPEYFRPLRQFAQTYHDRAGALAAAEALAPLLAEVPGQHRSPRTRTLASRGRC